MSGFIAISTTYVFGTLLTANGNLKQLNIVAASGMIINISLNFFLIPKFEAIGSAYASLITQFITAALQVIIVQYFFRFKINYTYLSTLVIFAAGVILITYISKGLHFEWTINFLIMVIASLLLASALRLLSIKSLLKIVKKEEEEIMS
jgi:peptidoglycan biosynthesis protein MviN/MurJ (putative lipid II flippase)